MARIGKVFLENFPLGCQKISDLGKGLSSEVWLWEPFRFCSIKGNRRAFGLSLLIENFWRPEERQRMQLATLGQRWDWRENSLEEQRNVLGPKAQRFWRESLTASDSKRKGWRLESFKLFQDSLGCYSISVAWPYINKSCYLIFLPFWSNFGLVRCSGWEERLGSKPLLPTWDMYFQREYTGFLFARREHAKRPRMPNSGLQTAWRAVVSPGWHGWKWYIRKHGCPSDGMPMLEKCQISWREPYRGVVYGRQRLRFGSFPWFPV